MSDDALGPVPPHQVTPPPTEPNHEPADVPAVPGDVPTAPDGMPDDAPVELASRRSMTLSISLLATSVLLAVLVVLPAPYAVTSPGPTRDTLGDQGGVPLISISGAPTYPSTGQLRLVTVSSTGGPGYPSTLTAVVRGWFEGATAIAPVEVMYPPELSRSQIDQSNQQQMVSSQENATVAALEELGYVVPATLTIAGTQDGSGAAGVLLKDDVLVTLDGAPLTTFTQLTDSLKATAAGSTVHLGITRAGAPVDVDVVTGARDGGGSQLGVFVDPVFDLPIDVKIKIDDIGGASAGTMFALGIIDKLTPEDEANGQVIAGTGTMDASGDVGEIGGIRQKLAGARRDGATWFLAPASNCSDVVGHVPSGLRVVRVATLHEAREAVIAIGAGAADSLPTCTAG